MRIRIGNDITIRWDIYRYNDGLASENTTGSIAEDLTNAINLTVQLGIYGKGIVSTLTEVIVDVNLLTVHVPKELTPQVGKYYVVLDYDKTNIELDDKLQHYRLDSYAFDLVSYTASADNVTDIAIESQLVAGIDGINGLSSYELAVHYEGFTGTVEDYLASLRQPAIEAKEEVDVALVGYEELKNELEDGEEDRTYNEQLRVAAETARAGAEATRALNETARIDAEEARVAAENNRANELASIRSDLNEKSIYNVNVATNTPSTYYTLETAIAAIPSNKRQSQMLIVYRTSNYEYTIAQYLVSYLTDGYFINTTNWKVIVTTSTISDLTKLSNNRGFVNANLIGGNALYATIIDAATVIPIAYRQAGCLMVAKIGNETASHWELLQYQASSLTDIYWLNSSNWKNVWRSDVTSPTIINVNAINNKTTGYASLSDAIAAVPLINRLMGVILTYRIINTDKWAVYQYGVSDTTDTYWLNTSYWKRLNSDYIDDKINGISGIFDFFYEYGLIDKQNGNVISSTTYKYTPYLPVKVGVELFSAEDAKASKCSFYDVNLNFISSITGGPLGANSLTILSSENIPSNAKYYRASGRVNAYIKGHSIGDSFVSMAKKSDITNIESDLAQLTETTNRISSLQGKDYTSLMEVGYSLTPSSTVIGDIITLTRGTNSAFNSIKTRVYGGVSYDITGAGGAGPRLYIITDLDNKLVSIATAGLAASLTINIEKDGYLTVNARNDNITYTPKVIVKSVFDYITAVNNRVDLINQSLLKGNIVNYMPINIGTTMTADELITNYPNRATTDLLKSNFDIRFESKASNFTLRYATYDSDGVTVLSYVGDITSFTIPSNTNYRVCFAKSDGNIVDKNEISSSVIASFIEPQVKKKWFALGDSITQGFVSYLVEGTPTYSVIRDKCWVTKLSNIRTDLILTNYGRGGEGYLDPDQMHTAKDSVDAINFADCDIATLAYGINDWKGNQIVGTVSDSPTLGTTVLSNMKYCIEKIISDNPACKIYIISPLNCIGYAFDYGDESTNYALGYTFSNSGTLESFVGKLKEVAEYYGIEFIDMTHNSVVNRKSLPSLLIDGVHPSEYAHKAIAIELSYKI